MGTVTNRRVSHRYGRLGVETFSLASTGGVGFAIYFDGDACAEKLQGLLVYRTVYLYPIFPFVGEFRVQQAMVELFIVGQQQETFAVEIQAANGIHVLRHGEKIFQRRLPFLRSELRQHVERLIYDEIQRHDALKSLMKGSAVSVKINPAGRRDSIYGWVSKYREINFPTQY